jgi:hypothetical protein
MLVCRLANSYEEFRFLVAPTPIKIAHPYSRGSGDYTSVNPNHPVLPLFTDRMTTPLLAEIWT